MKKIKHVTFTVVLILITLILTELTAHIFFVVYDQKKGGNWSNLDAYEMPDPNNPQNYLLRSGYTSTLKQSIEEKEKRGKVLGIHHLKLKEKELSISPDEVILRINKNGFRGGEIDPQHTLPRILMIGDSCTFGCSVGKYTYPNAAKKEFERLKLDVEVINAGVEGYQPKNVLWQIEKLKALQPKVVTIYLGWNAMFQNDSFSHLLPEKSRSLSTIRLFNTLYRRISGSQKNLKELNKALFREKNPDPNDPLLKELDSYKPHFVRDIEKIIQEMQSVNSHVVLITLPGLYVVGEPFSEKALQIGHMPQFTNNPYVMAKMTQKYNQILLNLATKHNVGLIDLAKWSKTNLQPTDDHFIDSVHLRCKSQGLVGKYIATKLQSYLTK